MWVVKLIKSMNDRNCEFDGLIMGFIKLSVRFCVFVIWIMLVVIFMVFFVKVVVI